MKLDEVQGFLDMYDAKLNEDCSIRIGGMTVNPVVSYNGFHRFFKSKEKKLKKDDIQYMDRNAVIYCLSSDYTLSEAIKKVDDGYMMNGSALITARQLWLEAGSPNMDIDLEKAKPTPHSSIDFLTRAVHLQQERAKAYDVGGTMEGERSMGRTVQAFNVITGHTLRESDGWLLLQLLKDVRDQTNGPHMDSLEDCVSYAALKAEARAAGK